MKRSHWITRCYFFSWKAWIYRFSKKKTQPNGFFFYPEMVTPFFCFPSRLHSKQKGSRKWWGFLCDFFFGTTEWGKGAVFSPRKKTISFCWHGACNWKKRVKNRCFVEFFDSWETGVVHCLFWFDSWCMEGISSEMHHEKTDQPIKYIFSYTYVFI